MQSTGQALAHRSQAMHLFSSNSWMPRYRGASASRRSGYWTDTGRWNQYLSVIRMPTHTDRTVSVRSRK